MKALLQRVSTATVRVDEKIIGEIGEGLVIFLGIHAQDTEKEIDYLVQKIVNLRVFGTEKSGFDLSLLDAKKEALIVSQFTLYGSTEKGRRPDFSQAAPPEVARKIYEDFVGKFKATGIQVATGQFQAHMQVELNNDGPVTLMVESK